MTQPLIRFLRFTERYTKTDMVYLVKNGGWVFLGQLVTSLSAFAVMVALANMVEKGEYGEYRFLISMVLLLSLFTLPGMNAALTQSTAKGHDGQLPQVVSVRRKWGLIASLLSLLLAGYYALQGNEGLGLSFLVVAALIPFYAVYQSYFFYLQGKQDFRRASLIQVWTQPLLIIFLVATAYFVPVAAALIAAYLVGTTLIQYIGYRLTLRLTTTDAPLDDDVVSYGKFLTFYNAFPLVITAQCSLIFTWLILGAEELALLSIALIFPQEIDRLWGICYQVLAPKFVINNTVGQKLVTQIMKLQFILVFFCVVYIFVAPFIFRVFFQTYLDSVMFSMLAIFITVFSPRILLRGYLYTQKMKQQIVKVSFFTMLFQLIVSLLLIYYFGLLGAVAGILLGAIFEFTMLAALILKLKFPNSHK